MKNNVLVIARLVLSIFYITVDNIKKGHKYFNRSIFYLGRPTVWDCITQYMSDKSTINHPVAK